LPTDQHDVTRPSHNTVPTTAAGKHFIINSIYVNCVDIFGDVSTANEQTWASVSCHTEITALMYIKEQEN